MSNPNIGYAAMLGSSAPSRCPRTSAAAEEAGFTGVMAADHYKPGCRRQGSAPSVWKQ